MLLISDYGKGVCTRNLLRVLGRRALALGIPILVDPAIDRSWSDYGSVTLIKANRVEAMSEAGGNGRPLATARRLADTHRCSIVVTYGRFGMVTAEQAGGTSYLPATPTVVRDVCGAGDTVLASIALEILEGKSLRTACHVAADAASHQVGKLGIGVPTSYGTCLVSACTTIQ
jgi:D-beta-D-heptose 7-phosphate kinase / D-beta-D-heptose 1-phosphate adenosyltransferase